MLQLAAKFRNEFLYGILYLIARAKSFVGWDPKRDNPENHKLVISYRKHAYCTPAPSLQMKV